MDLTKDVSDKKMKDKGYNTVAQNGAGTVFMYNKKLKEDLNIGATVNLLRQDISLNVLLNNYGILLSTNPFSFDHKDFEGFEKSLLKYAVACYNIENTVGIPDSIIEKAVSKGLTLEDRQKQLWRKIKEIGKEKEYDREECERFFRYWTEKNDKGRKMRFEMQETFSVGGRLVTWFENIKNKKFSSFTEKKIDKQEEDLKARKPLINHKELFG